MKMKKKISTWFERFRNNAIVCAHGECGRKDLFKKPVTKIDSQIGLGVLLWGMGAIAEADGEFLPEEDKKIEDIILSHTNISKTDLPVTLAAIKQAAIGKIDFYRIAREINKTLPNKVKVALLENLFRVAYADKRLDNKEFKIIKRVYDLFHMTQENLSDIGQKIKEEVGLEPDIAR